jgi:kynurenine aminotransferase
LQEATAIGFEEADKHNFWDESKRDMKNKMDKFNTIWDELGLPVRILHRSGHKHG